MKKFFLIVVTIATLMTTSCTSSDDVKEISGTLLFNEIGTYSFNINAENIQAKITIAGPNNGDIYTFENVPLFRTVEYTAKVGIENTSNFKTELLNNLVVMYEAESGIKSQDILDKGYIKIDWIGYD
jgi:hypothetical protein